LSEGDASIAGRERREIRQLLCDLADYAKRLRLVCADDLPREQERAAANRANNLLPKRMDAVARNDAEAQMGFILEYGVGCCEDDVGQQRVFRVDGRRSIKRGNQWCRDVEDVRENFLSVFTWVFAAREPARTIVANAAL
jgi:hypothetical protein